MSVEEQFIVDVDISDNVNECVVLVYRCRGYSNPKLTNSFTGKEAIEAYDRLVGKEKR